MPARIGMSGRDKHKTEIELPGSGRTSRLTLIAVALISVWIRTAYPLNAVGYAGHDDVLFVRLAGTIGAGDWLGHYDNLTHAKGMVYSAFILLNYLAGTSLILAEHLCYLAASLCFAMSLNRVCRVRGLALVLFVVLAFNPSVWNPSVGSRVVRENLYVSLTLLVLALGIRCFAAENSGGPLEQWRRKRALLSWLGLTLGLFWLTREEGVWLAPSMLLLLSYWLSTQRSAWRQTRPIVAFVSTPVLAMAFVIGAVNSLNYLYYGSFRNNDFRSADFQAAYGALARIRHDHWQRYVVFPKDARARAYAMSAAARELQPHLDGEVGNMWRDRGCAQMRLSPCDEVLSGWFMWALRDAVARAGHYSSAPQAQQFYERLAAEINAGCKSHAGDCLPARSSLMPPWRAEYANDTFSAALDIFGTLQGLGGPAPDPGASVGKPFQLAIIEASTNSRLAPILDGTGQRHAESRDAIRRGMAQPLTRLESMFLKIGLPCALVGLAAWIVGAAVRRRVEANLIVAIAITVAVTVRVLLLAFLEATSIPSNNIVYLLPATPLALALGVLMAGITWQAVARRS